MKVWEQCGWTKSRYFSFIRSGLRRMWTRYPVKYRAMEKARRHYTGEDKRTKWEYLCAKCNEWHKAKDVQVDHIKPAGSLKEYSDLPEFVSNLFCGEENLQILCKPCHSEKTKEERKKK